MNKIKSIINKWDPIDLFPFSPDDEYEQEIILISKISESINNSKLLAKEIQDVFTYSFSETFTKSFEDCEKIAKKILEKK